MNDVTQRDDGATRTKPARGGVIARALDLFVHAPLMRDDEAAIQLGISIGYLKAIRSSDTFRATLGALRERIYGEAIRKLQQTTVETATTALNTLSTMMTDAGTLPSTKIEAAKEALAHHDRTERRHAPQPNQNQTNVSITITAQELAEARQAANAHGHSLELEANSHAHAAPIPAPGGDRNFAALPPPRSKV